MAGRFPQGGIQQGFYSFSRVLFSDIECSSLQKGSIRISTKVSIPNNYLNFFQQPAYSETPIWLVLYEDGDVKSLINTGTTVRRLTGASLGLTVNVPEDVTPGKYIARLCIGTVLPGFPSINSTEFDLCAE